MAFGLWALIETVRQGRKPEANHRAGLALCFATLLAGGLGMITGLIKTLQYAADHPLEQQIRFVILGLSETLHNVTLALCMLLLTALAYALGRLRSR